MASPASTGSNQEIPTRRKNVLDRGWRRAVLQLYYPGALASVDNTPTISVDVPASCA